jgi:hypothetical protein
MCTAPKLLRYPRNLLIFVFVQLDLWSLLKLSDPLLSHTPKLRSFFKRGLFVGGVSLVAVVARVWMANGVPSRRIINR